MAADQLIKKNQAFYSAIFKAEKLAEQGKLVTSGNVPGKPRIGYGFNNSEKQISGLFDVAKFVEKPALGTANECVDSGSYYRNTINLLVLKFNLELK